MEYTEDQVTAGLMAVAAHAGGYKRASRSIKWETHGFTVSAGTLSEWVRYKYPQRYMELRDKYRDQLEKQLADQQTDIAAQAVETAALAVEQARERLETGKDQDPARTAANLATVQEKAMRSSLTLQNRPSTIKETRDLPEILRRLAALKVIEIPEEQSALTSGDPVPQGPETPDSIQEPAS